MTGDRAPVRSLEDLDALNVADVCDGYRDGRAGFPCGDNRSRAYWHGWRNGRVDAGFDPVDEHMARLAQLYLARNKLLAGACAGSA